MPAALQTKIAFKTSLSGGSFESLAAASGDSLTFYTIPGAGDGPVGWLAEIWAADSASVAEFSFTASRFHDQTYGIRVAVPASSSFAPTNTVLNVSPLGFDQPIYSADVMTVRANGTSSDKAFTTWTEYYPNLPGVAFNGVTSDYVRSNMRNLVGVNVQPTSGTCTWGTSVALNSQTDLLHKGRQYAVLGFTAQSAVASVAIQGIDTGNLRVGGVVTGDPKTDAYLFSRLADFYKAPLIPVIQANNSGAINVYAANITGAAQVIDVTLAELTTLPIVGGGL